MPNLENVLPEFRNLAYDPEGRYSVPYFFGSTGIAYDSADARLSELVTQRGWGVLFDPKLQQRYVMIDDSRYALGIVLKFLGYDPNTTTRGEVVRAGELVKAARPRIQAFSGDTYIQMLARGDVKLAYGYSGDIVGVMAERPSIRYYVPPEGTLVGVDNMAILQESRQKDLAAKFINFILSPDVHARIANRITWGCPNGPARKYIRKDLIENQAIYLPPELVRRSVAIRDLGKPATDLYAQTWQSVVEQ